jgi:hypothetical protein
MKKIMRNKIELSDASSSRLVEDLDFFLPIEEVSLYIFIYLNEGCGSGGHDAEKLVLPKIAQENPPVFSPKRVFRTQSMPEPRPRGSQGEVVRAG